MESKNIYFSRKRTQSQIQKTLSESEFVLGACKNKHMWSKLHGHHNLYYFKAEEMRQVWIYCIVTHIHMLYTTIPVNDLYVTCMTHCIVQLCNILVNKIPSYAAYDQNNFRNIKGA